ncbi:DUF6281 family protein [Streptomyces sp. NPDC085946]|uniref:DUF6281 family protein n=1 Tax=Streptomyces sp. NPDC085946 TaxID=3365744 RepID=UPI0037CEF62C
MKTPSPSVRRTALAVLPAVIAAAVTAGCAEPAGETAGSAPSCAYVVEYDGRRYLGRDGTGLPVGEPLGSAVRPACDDTPNDPDPGDRRTRVTAHAVEGVDPSVALAVAEAPGDFLLVTADSLTTLPPELRRLVGD